MYVYWQSETGLWTVGYLDSDGTRITDSDHTTREAAAQRVHWLNSGSDTQGGD